MHSVSIDTKGRFAIPTCFRERLRELCGASLVFTIDPSGCLLLYPEPEWQEIARKLMRLPNMKKSTRRKQRLLLGHAAEIDMDKQGRVLVPPGLRKFAKLEGQAVIIGQGNKFEIWDQQTWDSNVELWTDEENEEMEGDDDLEGLSI